MFQLRPSAVAALLTLAIPASASADVIVSSFYHSASACVSWTTNPTGPGPTESCNSSDTSTSNVWTATHSVTDVNPVGAGEATVDQSSYVASTQAGVTSFGATAEGTATVTSALVDPGFIAAFGNTYYTVYFTLTEAYSYVLSGAFSAVSTDLGLIGNHYNFALYDGNFAPIVYRHGPGNSADVLAQNGILAPGDYYLQLAIQGGALSGIRPNWGGGGTVTAGGSFDLSLTPVSLASVPEPGSVLLLSTGVLGVGVRRWRQKRT